MRKELGLLAIVGCVLACSGERAAPEPSGRAPSSAAPASVDELKRALAPRLSHSVAGLETTSHPSGARLVRLKGRFGTAAVVRTRADGTLEHGCFDDAERAARFLAQERGRP